MHKFWRSVGSPRYGNINSARLLAKINYKNAIKFHLNRSQSTNSKAINNSLLSNDSKKFWRIWNSHFKGNFSESDIIDGISDPPQIANSFADYVAKTFVNSFDDCAAMSEFNSLCQDLYSEVNDI